MLARIRSYLIHFSDLYDYYFFNFNTSKELFNYNRHNYESMNALLSKTSFLFHFLPLPRPPCFTFFYWNRYITLEDDSQLPRNIWIEEFIDKIRYYIYIYCYVNLRILMSSVRISAVDAALNSSTNNLGLSRSGICYCSPTNKTITIRFRLEKFCFYFIRYPLLVQRQVIFSLTFRQPNRPEYY